MRRRIIDTVRDLRYYCAAYVPEFMRLLLVRLVDEPFQIKQATCFLF